MLSQWYMQEWNRQLNKEQDSTSVPRRLRGPELGRGDAVPGRSVPSNQANTPKKSDKKQVGFHSSDRTKKS